MTFKSIMTQYLVKKLLVKMFLTYLLIGVLLNNFFILNWEFRVRVIFGIVSLFNLIKIGIQYKILITASESANKVDGLNN